MKKECNLSKEVKRTIMTWIIGSCIGVTWAFTMYAGIKILNSRRNLEDTYYYIIQKVVDGTIDVSEEGTTVILSK